MEKNIVASITKQINKEFYSAYLYLDFANYFSDQGLDGFANWYTVQAKEEEEHAAKFITYLQDNNEKVALAAIDAPKGGYKDVADVLNRALEHEKEVTASIHAIYKDAIAANDYRTTNFLNWFVDEQLEEEKNATDLITRFELITGGPGLLILDQQLAGRTE